MKKFEYKIVSVMRLQLNHESFRSELAGTFNQYGREGWELVNSESIINKTFLGDGARTGEILLFFKRELDH